MKKQHSRQSHTVATHIKRMIFSALFVMALFTLSLAQAQEDALALEAPEQIRPFTNTDIKLTSPQAGSMTLVMEYDNEQIPLIRDLHITSGVNQFTINGLDLLGGILPQGQANLKAYLTTADTTLEASRAVQVRPSASGISYVLLSRESLPQTGGEDLYADHQMSKPGRLLINLYAQDDRLNPLFSWNLERKDSLPRAFRWDRTIKGSPAPAGNYVLTFEAAGSDQDILERGFTLTEGAASPLLPQITAPDGFLPQGEEASALWQTMMTPLAVVDIGDMAHQRVLERPDAASPSVGLVHGQTAGMQILELDVNGFARVRAARHGDGEWIEGYVPQTKLKVIVPNERYGLVIDKAKQTLTVYERGIKKGELRVSTGVYKPPGDSWFDTVPGAFFTQDRITEFTSEGFCYEHAMRIDGGNLIHATGFTINGRTRDYAAQQAQLGQMASHGCVRVNNIISPEGLNAWWLYANIPRNTKVLVLPGNPEAIAEQAADTIKAPEPSQQPAPTSAYEQSANLPTFQVLEEGDIGDENEAMQVDFLPQQKEHTDDGTGTRIVLSFGGDSVLGSEERTRKLPESFHSIVEKEGFAWPYSGLKEVFQKDDVSMVNLENVLKDSAKGLDERMHNFRGPTEFAQILTLGGIDLVNLANNHFIDYGQDGKNSTRKALRDTGVPYAGYSSLYVFEKEGIRIGFAGIRETVFHQNRQRIAHEIKELKKQGCHYIVYTCHFGNEYEQHHNELQTLMARTAIDAGADLVIGHHPHVVQGIEEYSNGLIFYSLGNLVFGGNLELSTFDGLVAQVILDFEQQQLTNTRVKLIPIITSGIRPQNDFRPIPAKGEDKQRILDTIHSDSAIPYPEEFELKR